MNDPVERNIQSDIHGRNALRHIEHICDFGDRFYGTEGDQKTCNYAQDHFEQLGLQIEFTTIRGPTYNERSVELVLTDTGTEIEAISPFFTKACQEGVKGELVYVGEGRDKDYEGVDVNGKIVVLSESATGWDWFWLGLFSQRAAICGAVGLIIIHPFPWPNRMSMETGILDISQRFADDQVPSVCISAIDGFKVMQHIGQGKTNAFLKIDSEMYEVDGTILSGVLEGSHWPDERIAVISHRDSPIPPAANDNGSGIGIQLELARVLSKYKPKRSVEFICSTAEESASAGAWSFVQAHKARISKMKALINIDMVAVGGCLYLVEGGQWHESEPFTFPAWLMEKIEDVADELGYYVGRKTVQTTSEETRFHMAGVPVAAFWKPDDYHYHSYLDTPDRVDANTLKAVADITAITLWRLANEEPGD
ncbi:MAG: M20/M25/M40 family metallo-hydrolase [Anaerolineales bacterium]|nr:M20/M25/M40 family metallo-hydrolase [Anaerolineales bacterium]